MVRFHKTSIEAGGRAPSTRLPLPKGDHLLASLFPVLNLNKWNKDGSLEAARMLTVPALAGENNMMETRGGVDGIYLVFDYICLSDFLFTHS